MKAPKSCLELRSHNLLHGMKIILLWAQNPKQETEVKIRRAFNAEQLSSRGLQITRKHLEAQRNHTVLWDNTTKDKRRRRQ